MDAEPATKVGGTLLDHRSDFEILVFPGDDEHDVLHLFDRFANRTKSDHVHQFTVDRASVLAGVEDGLTGSQIVQELTDRARAPSSECALQPGGLGARGVIGGGAVLPIARPAKSTLWIFGPPVADDGMSS